MPHVIEVKWEVDLHRHLRAVQVGNGLRAGTFMHTSARNCPCTATSFFLAPLVIHQSVLIVINNLDAPSSLCKGKRSSAIQSNIHVLGKMQKIFSTTLSGKSLKNIPAHHCPWCPAKWKKGKISGGKWVKVNGALIFLFEEPMWWCYWYNNCTSDITTKSLLQ